MPAFYGSAPFGTQGGSPFGTPQTAKKLQTKSDVQVPLRATQDVEYEGGARSPQAALGGQQTAFTEAQRTGVDYTVDPYGYTNYSNISQQGRTTDTHQAKLQAEAEARRMSSLSGLMSARGGGTPSPRATHSGFGAGVSPEEFAQFKDTTGNITRGAVDSLRDLYAGTGNVGAQREGLEHIVQGGAGRLSDFARDQMIRAGQRREDISDQVYGGDITQRGQDMAQQQQMMSQLMGLFSQRY